MHHGITLKNDLGEIETMVEAVEGFGQVCHLSIPTIFTMNLVLEEIITNIISYAYVDDEEHDIIVDFTWDKDVLTLVVTDDGIPFNPLEVVAPNLLIPVEEREVGGLGIYFVTQRMDEVLYTWEQGHNVLTMRKSCSKEVVI